MALPGRSRPAPVRQGRPARAPRSSAAAEAAGAWCRAEAARAARRAAATAARPAERRALAAAGESRRTWLRRAGRSEDAPTPEAAAATATAVSPRRPSERLPDPGLLASSRAVA